MVKEDCNKVKQYLGKYDIKDEYELVGVAYVNILLTTYDNSAVIQNKIQIEYSEWNKCYCSDLTRAIITAKSISSRAAWIFFNNIN